MEMATFRLVRQSSRSSRFARVSVEVSPAADLEIEIEADVPAELRREAPGGLSAGCHEGRG